MKIKTITFLGALALVGCSERDFFDNNPTTGSKNGEINIGANYETQTRATEAGFADGDAMGIFISDYAGGEPASLTAGELHAENIKFTYDGSTGRWKGVTTLYWNDDSTPVDIYGYYPFDTSMINPVAHDFQITPKQNSLGTSTTKGGYEASDFLQAKAVGVTPTDQIITLTYHHLMAGITVRLQEGSGFTAGEWAEASKSVWIENTHTGCSVNIETAEVNPDMNSEIQQITPIEYNGDYRAVAVPQTIESGKPILLIDINGHNYNLTKTEAITFAGGKMHTFTLTVDKKTSMGDYEVKLTNESITPWVDDAEFHDGIVTQYVIVETTSGKLKESIAAAGLDYRSITKLKVVGSVDYQDLAFIRDEMTAVTALNLYEATVDDEDNANDDVIANLDHMTNLNKIILPKKLRGIGANAFNMTHLVGAISFPEGLEFIDDGAFYQGDDGVNLNTTYYLGEIKLPSTLKRIGSRAFSRCLLTGQLNLPQGIESIGEDAFSGAKFTGPLILPETLLTIGDLEDDTPWVYSGCFGHSTFEGDLTIPQGTKRIAKGAFFGSTFTGNLILPEGLETIGREAFGSLSTKDWIWPEGGCGFKGELKLPSTLKEIGIAAFANNKFSSIVWPNNLRTIGSEAFRSNRYLRGTVTVPKNITAIPDGLFQDCPLISGIELHEDVTYIGEYSFGNADGWSGNGTYISSIVCNAIEPPVMKSNSFEGLPLNNLTVQVPAESVTLYKQDSRWGAFKRITAYKDFICRPSIACALNNERTQPIIVDAKGDWTLMSKPDWVQLSATTGTGKRQVNLSFQPLTHGSGSRSGEIIFSLDNTEYTTSITVAQYDYEYEEDEVLTLQSHTKGNGIKLLLLGDGWDGEAIATGTYIKQCRENMEYFFGLPPYDRLREYFDVYAAVALSQESGINTEYTNRDTRFNSVYAIKALNGATSTCISNTRQNNIIPDTDLIFNYILNEIAGFTREDLAQGLTILIPNTDEYPSSTYFYQPSDYWQSYTLSICPLSSDPYPNDARGIIQMEAGGIGFGKLASEKITQNKYFKDQNEVLDMQQRGYWLNVSLSGKNTDVYWKDLIYDPRYSDQVDIFEGALGYTRNIFRSEANSCVQSGIPYYNAISRYLITKRVIETAGEEFTSDEFYKNDTNSWGATSY